MVTTTAGQLITASLKLMGVLAASETPTASEQQDALLALNGWIDYLGTDRQTMLSIGREVFSLTAGQQTYTIGDGGDVPIEAPLALDHVGLLLPNSLPPTEMALTLITEDAYAVLAIKTLESSLPTQAFYERPTAQLGTLWLWPLPTDTASQIAIYWPNAITQFSSLTEEVTLAPAYYMALRFNLAALLYPEYGIQPRGDVLQHAANALSALKRANFTLSDLGIDAALVCRGAGGYNILTDQGA